MASSVSYQTTTFPIAEEDKSTEDFKSPPVRTWKKFPPTTVERIAYLPDSASTPYNQQACIQSLGLSPLRQLRRNPCALSPIDRLKIGVKKRGRELCKSFELNQTCPQPNTNPTAPPGNPPLKDGQIVLFIKGCNDVSLSSIHSSDPSHSSSAGSSTRSHPVRRKRTNMEKIRVDGANGLRFSARRTKGCFISGTGSPYSSSVVNSSGNTMPLSNTNTTTTTTSDSIMRISKSEMNPNKAVFTIDSKSSRILIVNKNACEMLGYSSKELCEIEFSNLLVNKTKSHVSALAEGQLNSEDGTLVLLSGKVVEMSMKSGSNLAVSLWIRKIDTDGRCLAVAEPVERRVARLMIDDEGSIVTGDYESLLLFQMDSVEDFIGKDVKSLIPAIKLPDTSSPGLPKSVSKQKATGKTKDGLSFPLCLIIDRVTETPNQQKTKEENVDHEEEIGLVQFSVTIWVFNNLSGLMVIDETGLIESCNHHFSMLMFGYAQAKIIGQHVSKVIPNFGQEMEYVDLSRSRNATISSLDNEESETETDHVERTDLTMSDRLSSCADNVKVCLDFSASKVNSSMVSELSDDISNIKSLSSDTRSMHGGQAEDQAGGGGGSASLPLTKSVSDNLLCHENHENNRNLANNVGNGKRVGNKGAAAAPSGGGGLDSVCDNTFEDDYSQLMDNEILTPVNETDYFGCASNNNSADVVSQPTTNIAPKNSATSSRSFNASGVESVINDLPSTATSSRSFGKATNPAMNDESNSEGSQQQQQQQNRRAIMHIQDGKYKGEAVHNDGNVIDIIYTVSGQTLPSGRVHCVWVSRDPDTELNRAGKSAEEELGEMGDEEEEEEDRNQNLTLTFDSVNSTVENSLGQAIKATAQNTTTTTTTTTNPNALLGSSRAGVPVNNSRPNSMSLLSQCDDELVAGEFSKHYTTLKQIGKGAYGYVKMAYRNSDNLLVIAKFILKDKLCPQFMVLTEDKREIPMEIYLLTTLDHPNIVSLIDVYETNRFYQLVMEKHGCGMDLFEFIDRLPMMDEKLACYIFRQIANAVDYLHSLHILHRDLKDENIIIDQNFHVKLIDFGSATFMEEGKLFSTFYGTTEYCSPEVLSGNKYAGPELEMWSLGVTLYVIMFFENPFVDIEETLHASLVIPQKVSGQLERLLLAILDKNPVTRCTMRQLIADLWLNQEINPAQFNFACVVPCESFESNPEKYYNGQVLSSGTAISTTSPQNSLSLVDGDSMLDVEGEGEEEEDEVEEDDLEDDGEECGIEKRSDDERGAEDETGPIATVIKVIEPKSATVSSDPLSRNSTRQQQQSIVNETNPKQSVASSPSSKRPILSVCVNNHNNAVPKDASPALIVSGAGYEKQLPFLYGGEGFDTNTGEYQHFNDVAERNRNANNKHFGGDQIGVKKRSKRKLKKRGGRKVHQKNNPPANLEGKPLPGGLAMSKSENNLFEKGMKFAAEGSSGGGGNKLFAGYEGVVTSMRDLQFDPVDQNPTKAMNDFSKTQVLNTIALSTEAMARTDHEGIPDVQSSRIIEELDDRSPLKQDGMNACKGSSGWTATVELTPKSSNRSNFQILSISYNHTGGDEDFDGCYEDGYENDSWDDEEDEAAGTEI